MNNINQGLIPPYIPLLKLGEAGLDHLPSPYPYIFDSAELIHLLDQGRLMSKKKLSTSYRETLLMPFY